MRREVLPSVKVNPKDSLPWAATARSADVISLIGNCQLHRMQYVMGVNDVPEFTFLANTDLLGLGFDVNRVKEQVATSDLVIAQPITNLKHPLHHQVLRALNPNIIFVPYIFVDGVFSLCTEGGVGTHAFGGDRLLESFGEIGVDATLHAFRAGTLNFYNRARFDQSLAELQRREAEYCHVTVSDHILATYQDHPFLTTHNHPMPALFDVYCARIFAAAGLPYRPLPTLSHFDAAVFAFDRRHRVFSPYDAEALGIRYPFDEGWFHAGHEVIVDYAGRFRAAQEEQPANPPTRAEPPPVSASPSNVTTGRQPNEECGGKDQRSVREQPARPVGRAAKKTRRGRG